MLQGHKSGGIRDGAGSSGGQGCGRAVTGTQQSMSEWGKDVGKTPPVSRTAFSSALIAQGWFPDTQFHLPDLPSLQKANLTSLICCSVDVLCCLHGDFNVPRTKEELFKYKPPARFPAPSAHTRQKDICL